MEYYVYVHRKADTGEIFYIGKGSGNRAVKKSSRTDWWKHIEEKHGRTVEIPVRGLTEEQAFDLEREFIEFYGLDNLCNLRDGGLGGVTPTEETRKKMSAAKKGKKKSLATREKMRIASTGRHHSEETKEKLRKASLGNTSNPWTEESRKKLSIALTGITRTPEHCKAISEAKKGKPGAKKSEEEKKQMSERAKGHIVSEETKAKISKANKGRKHTEEECKKMSEKSRINNAKMKKPILCSNGMFFAFSGDAVSWLRSIGHLTACRANIVSCCTGKLKTAYGFKWNYAHTTN